MEPPAIHQGHYTRVNWYTIVLFAFSTELSFSVDIESSKKTSMMSWQSLQKWPGLAWLVPSVVTPLLISVLFFVLHDGDI